MKQAMIIAIIVASIAFLIMGIYGVAEADKKHPAHRTLIRDTSIVIILISVLTIGLTLAIHYYGVKL